MRPKEKQATPQVAFVFLGPLTNEPPAIAGNRARQRRFVSVLDYPYEPPAIAGNRARQRGFVSVPDYPRKEYPS